MGDQVVGFTTSTHQRLSKRAMCSMASLSTALLAVYDFHFPHTPPAVLPFFQAKSPSGLSLIMSTCILAILTHRIHPITSIVSGLLGGSLWCLGLTSFLGTRYWGDRLLFILAVGILFSLKAQPNYSWYLAKLFPCIDYVSWDLKGDINGTITPITDHRRLPMDRSNNFEIIQTQHGENTGEEHIPLSLS